MISNEGLFRYIGDAKLRADVIPRSKLRGDLIIRLVLTPEESPFSLDESLLNNSTIEASFAASPLSISCSIIIPGFFLCMGEDGLDC